MVKESNDETTAREVQEVLAALKRHPTVLEQLAARLKTAAPEGARRRAKFLDEFDLSELQTRIQLSLGKVAARRNAVQMTAEDLVRGRLLRQQRWGQQVTGQAITGGVVGVFIILPGIVLAFIGGVMIGNSVVAAGAVVLAIGAVVIIIGSVISGTLSQILSVALYHYAVEGQGVGPYSTEMLEGVVRPKGRAARA